MIALTAALALAAETHRFALVAGANDGGPGRGELRYAVDDARAMSRVLMDLGGVAPADALMLVEPDSAALRQGFDLVERRVEAAKAAGERTELVVYWSGHSDEDGLLLGGDMVTYSELRMRIDEIPADVEVVVLDSCASGAMIRSKGGMMAPAFLSDESSDVTGHAYLTSSSADEAAQESDRVGGSFFTHALVTGLRGAADATEDGRITLNEAYQFAYTETIARTERTQGGAQHPNYDIRLAGTGDLVMTDLRATSAGLVLDESLQGRVYIRDGGGRLVAELDKPGARALQLGLPPGSYTAVLDRDGVLAESAFELREGESYELDPAAFHGISAEIATARGSVPKSSDGFVDTPLSVQILPGLEYPIDHEAPQNVRMGFGMLAHHADRLEGVQASFVGNSTGGGRGVQGAFAYNVANGDLAGAQVAFAVNSSNGDLRGFQWTTGINHATEVHGMQVGVINHGGEVHGAQLGVINVAGEVDGAQVGVVNIAKDNRGTSVGLLTVNLSGYNHVWGYASDVDLGVGLTYGGRHIYTLLQGGVRPTPGNPMLTGWLGLGVHTGNKLYTDVDVAWGWARGPQEPGVGLFRTRVLIGLAPVKHFGVYVGPTVDVAWTAARGDALPTSLPVIDVGWPLWPGIVAGVRL